MTIQLSYTVALDRFRGEEHHPGSPLFYGRSCMRYMRPPWTSTTCRAIVSPMPLPPSFGVNKGSKIFSVSSRGNARDRCPKRASSTRNCQNTRMKVEFSADGDPACQSIALVVMNLKYGVENSRAHLQCAESLPLGP